MYEDEVVRTIGGALRLAHHRGGTQATVFDVLEALVQLPGVRDRIDPRPDVLPRIDGAVAEGALAPAFDDEARARFRRAEELATDGRAVSAEHLLVALVEQASVRRRLRSWGVDVPRLRLTLRGGPGSPTPDPRPRVLRRRGPAGSRSLEHLLRIRPMSESAGSALRAAFDEARRRRHRRVTPDHLLVGCLEVAPGLLGELEPEIASRVDVALGHEPAVSSAPTTPVASVALRRCLDNAPAASEAAPITVEALMLATCLVNGRDRLPEGAVRALWLRVRGLS
ncbi:MAG: Clp protease N-terminal domain-containing protein [Myxococcota bacterium]